MLHGDNNTNVDRVPAGSSRVRRLVYFSEDDTRIRGVVLLGDQAGSQHGAVRWHSVVGTA